MKSRILIYLSIILFTVTGCNKNEVLAPDFDVYADSLHVKAGKPLNFNFTGNPQLISFYSGEPFNNYEYSTTGRVLNDAWLSFSSTVSTGSQPNQLSVLVSSDFNGNYNITDIKAANWTDITGRFTLATSSTATASSEKNIFDLVVPGKPLYVAFRYITRPQAANGGQRNWNISNFLIKSTVENTSATIADYAASASFNIFSFGNKQTGRSTLSSAEILFKGNGAEELLEEYTEDWAVSKAIRINPNILGADRAIPVKGIANAEVLNFAHTFTEPGTYKVTFVASSNSVYGSKDLVKRMQITVQP